MWMTQLATRGRLFAGAAILIALTTALAIVHFLSRDPAGHYPNERVVYWQFSVENTTNQPMKDVQISSFAPLRSSWQQRLLSLEANVPLEEAVETRGEGSILANVALIPPFGRRDVRFEATMAMAEDHRNARLRNGETFSNSQASVSKQDTDMTALARQLERKTALETARSIYEWLVSEIQYTGYDPVDRGAIAAFEQRQGDCSEFASLGVALAGALGMQARKVNGFVVHEDGRLGPFDFHAWAEIRAGDRWVILDGQEQQFDPRPSLYMATGYGAEQSTTRGVKFAANSDAVRIQMER